MAKVLRKIGNKIREDDNTESISFRMPKEWKKFLDELSERTVSGTRFGISYHMREAVCNYLSSKGFKVLEDPAS